MFYLTSKSSKKSKNFVGIYCFCESSVIIFSFIDFFIFSHIACEGGFTFFEVEILVGRPLPMTIFHSIYPQLASNSIYVVMSFALVHPLTIIDLSTSRMMSYNSKRGCVKPCSFFTVKSDCRIFLKNDFATLIGSCLGIDVSWYDKRE